MGVLAADEWSEVLRKSGMTGQIKSELTAGSFSYPGNESYTSIPRLRNVPKRVMRFESDGPRSVTHCEDPGIPGIDQHKSDRFSRLPTACEDLTNGASALNRITKTFMVKPTIPLSIAGMANALNWLIGRGKSILQVHWPVPHGHSEPVCLTDVAKSV